MALFHTNIFDALKHLPLRDGRVLCDDLRSTREILNQTYDNHPPAKFVYAQIYPILSTLLESWMRDEVDTARLFVSDFTDYRPGNVHSHLVYVLQLTKRSMCSLHTHLSQVIVHRRVRGFLTGLQTCYFCMARRHYSNPGHGRSAEFVANEAVRRADMFHVLSRWQTCCLGLDKWKGAYLGCGQPTSREDATLIRARSYQGARFLAR